MTSFDIDEVLSQLTLNEKIQLISGYDSWHTVAIPRLNVPSIRVSDGPNGIRGTRCFDMVPGAILPNGTAIASTFDKELIFQAGQLLAEEARHKSVHVDLGPTTNIQRGPNGGRGFESFSEDPYLSGIATSQIVKGLQSKKVAATVKHFVCNDLEDDRMGSDSIITERALREIYLEPFRLAVKYSDPKAIMTSYNKVNGEHVSQSKKLMNDLLREEWKWDGTIMSDWYGTYTTAKAIENGLDLEMPGPPAFRTVESVSHQIATKELHTNHLNDRVRGVLKLVKYATESGIPYNGPEKSSNNTPETTAFLRKLAAQSIVLLKNEDNILPLKKDDKIAVIGPNSKYSANTGGGSASLSPYYRTTPYQGIVDKMGGYKPTYTVGAHAHCKLPGLSEQMTNLVTGKEGVHVSLFNEPPEVKDRGPPFREFDLNTSLHQFYNYLYDEYKGIPFYAEFEGIFEPEFTAEYEFSITVIGTGQLFIDDHLIVDNKTKQTSGDTFYGCGTIEEKGRNALNKGQKYKVRIEFGSTPTSSIQHPIAAFPGNGAILFGVARVIDPIEEIAKAVEIAKSVDKVVLVIGTNGDGETEGQDRENLTLPGYTNDLVSSIIKAQPNTIVVNQSGTPCEFPWIANAKAVLQAWFGGNELGNAIADVLYGDVNPSGKLSLTFPMKFRDNPAYLNFKTEKGRVLYGEDIFVGYRYYEKLQKKVLFPFGYGLSYTQFKFDDLSALVDEANDKITVSVKITNVGGFKGKEVVQVYFAAQDPDIIRPVKELKGFEKIELEAGESKTVCLELSLKDSLSYFDEYESKWSLKAGEYDVLVGPSSDDIELRSDITVANDKLWLGL